MTPQRDPLERDGDGSARVTVRFRVPAMRLDAASAIAARLGGAGCPTTVAFGEATCAALAEVAAGDASSALAPKK